MNKLGFYLHQSIDQNGMWDAISRVQPPAILIHADTANNMLLQEIRRFRSPEAFVIGRMYKDNDTQRRMLESDDPEGQGRAMADEIINYDFGMASKRADNGRLLIDAWMSLNEAVPGPASSSFREEEAKTRRLLDNYDRFQAAFRQRLQEAGLEAVAFNFAAGNFTAPEHYLDFFPLTLAACRYLGFHEYGWPSLMPGQGASGAGLYHRCMEGIRARYGDQHRVIITEAGVTRAYGNSQAPDEGWLSPGDTLSEDAYWASLEWYNNNLLLPDDYVIGACLYEVGHDGRWESFRHLGQDNAGHDIHLIDRMVALKELAAPVAAAVVAPTPVVVRKRVTISGVVSLEGRRIAGATVRLLGSQDTLGGVREAASEAPTSIRWTRKISGFAGNRWQVWNRFVAREVAGLSWDEFKGLVDIYNPSLAAGSGQFEAERSYVLPENNYDAEIVWDRPLTGFAGTIWQCWQQYVENKVVGLTYEAFKQEVKAYNPALAPDGDRFDAGKRYNLPRNAGQKAYALLAITGRGGRFKFEDLPPGDYQLEVRAGGALPYSTGFSCADSVDLDVVLQPVAAAPAAAPAGAAAIGFGAPGFVGVAGADFVLNGQRLRFIGANIRGLVHYGDGQTLQWATRDHRVEQLRAASEMGVRVVRVFLPSVNADSQQTVDRLREVVDLVKRDFPNIYILPTFHNLYADVPFRVRGDEGFYARIDPNFPGDLLKPDFFTGGYRINYLPLVRRVVEEFRDEPQIFAWEVGNELKLNPVTGDLNSDPNVAAFIAFMLTVAQEIRQLDSNHLVTTGMISTHHAWLHNDDLRRRIYGSPLFDFVTVHCYNDENENDDSRVAQMVQKPFILEEAGFGRGYGDDRSGKVAEDLEKWFRLGASGYMPWGFMATGNDIGDGDSDSGMDRVLHRDWDSLFRIFQQRAWSLAQVDPNWRTPVTPVAPVTPVTPPERRVPRPATRSLPRPWSTCAARPAMWTSQPTTCSASSTPARQPRSPGRPATRMG